MVMPKLLYNRFTILIVALLISLILCGCVKASDSSLSKNLLPFPGTEWNMMPSEVKSALSIPDECCVQGTDNRTEYAFTVENLVVLDQETAVTFRFRDYVEADHLGLRFVYVYFTSNVDYASLQSAVTEELGEPDASDSTSCTWNSAEPLGPYMNEAYAEVKELNPEVYSTIYGTMKDDPAAWVTLSKTAADYFTANSNPDVLEEYQDCPCLIFWGNVTELLQYAQYGIPGIE